MKVQVIRAVIYKVVVNTDFEENKEYVEMYDSPLDYAKEIVQELQFAYEEQNEQPFLSWEEDETITAREIK